MSYLKRFHEIVIFSIFFQLYTSYRPKLENGSYPLVHFKISIFFVFFLHFMLTFYTLFINLMFFNTFYVLYTRYVQKKRSIFSNSMKNTAYGILLWLQTMSSKICCLAHSDVNIRLHNIFTLSLIHI